MKTAALLITALTLSASHCYSQAAGAYAGAAAQASGSAQAVGHAPQTAVSQSGAAAANATAKTNQVSGAASETSASAAQAGKTGAAATQASSLSAELTQKINSKNAKVGDEVIARTTSTAQLAQGTRLPKGTRLLGKVTEVQPRSGAQHDGHLAFAFDRAILRDGREVPIHATLQSISPSPAVSAMASGSDDFAAGATPMAVSGGGRASGGLLGGGGVSVPHTGLISNTVSGATSTVASTPARVTSTAGSAVQTTSAAAHQTVGAVRQTTGTLNQTTGSAVSAISTLPGVTASSSGSNTTILDAKGSNVDLSSGTQLTFSVAAQ